MSRTYRRKKDKPHNHSGSSNSIDDFIYQRLDYWEGVKGVVTAFGGIPEVKLKGKDYSLAKFKYHKDERTGWGLYYSKSMRQITHNAAKNKDKKSLHKALREDDEFIEATIGCLSWYA